VILLGTLFALGLPSATDSLAAGLGSLIGGVFASGSGAAPLASAHYQMRAVVGEMGLPAGGVNLTSVHYAHQPGFLASVSGPTATPTPTPTPGPLTRTVYSIGSQDGWVLESSATSDTGGSTNAVAATLKLGDDALRKQYRAILSFATGPALPDTAVITSVRLRLMRQGAVGRGDPLIRFQGFMADVRNGFFSTAGGLQNADFQAPASHAAFGPYLPSLVGSWYTLDLTALKGYINKLGTNGGLTQMHLRFKIENNNDAVANVLSLYSGNAANAANRPQLVITYH
jgi:hypothetical protein